MPENKELVNVLRTVIQEEIQPLRQEVRTIVQEELNPVRQELHDMRTGQDVLRTDLFELRTGQDELRTGLDELRSGLDELRSGQNVLTQDVSDLKHGQKRLENKVDKLEVRMENEVIEKINILIDSHKLEGDQIENLKTHLDERFDSIEIDTLYLVSRVSRLENLAK